MGLPPTSNGIARLAGTIAHEFNNVLGAVLAHSELLLEKLGSTSPHRCEVEKILHAAKRGRALAVQLLTLSAPRVVQPRVLDLNRLLAELEDMLRKFVGEGIQVVLDYNPRLGKLRADPGQLEDVIVNLAVNARDAMQRGGKLCVKTDNVELGGAHQHENCTAPPGRYILLAISDTGIGMEKETLVRIFEPFFTTKQEGKGNGLGLSAVYDLVKQSGGWVSVSTQPSKGTLFEIYFPTIDDLDAESTIRE